MTRQGPETPERSPVPRSGVRRWTLGLATEAVLVQESKPRTVPRRPLWARLEGLANPKLWPIHRFPTIPRSEVPSFARTHAGASHREPEHVETRPIACGAPRRIPAERRCVTQRCHAIAGSTPSERWINTATRAVSGSTGVHSDALPHDGLAASGRRDLRAREKQLLRAPCDPWTEALRCGRSRSRSRVTSADAISS